MVKNPPASAGDIGGVGLIPGLGRSLGEGNGNPLQNSCQENPMDRGAWWATVHVVAKSLIQLKRLSTHSYAICFFFFNFCCPSWRRKWQPTPSILAWRILWMEDPGGLQSMGSQRVGHD